MASFIGRSGHHILFTEAERAVIVDSRVSIIVASGATSELQATREWGDGEFSEADQLIAENALSTAETPEQTGRLYTIPRGAQQAAKKALAAGGGTPVARTVGALLAAGGQIDFDRLANINNYFERHADDLEDANRLFYGGDAGEKWATTIVSREAVTASATIETETLADILENPEAGPEFVARVSLEGDGIDRLYRVDIDGRSYVWDDNTWNDMGHADWNIWNYDKALDNAAEAEFSVHVMIDPESALQIAANLQFGNVHIEDINLHETSLAREAAPELDWEFLDSVVTAAGGTPGDGIYTPDERSENASQQVRDKNGKFAKQGGRVMINGVPGATGIITRVNPSNGTVEVSLDSGGSQVVYGNQVEGVGQYTTTIPGKPVEVPRVDFSGILAQPRTPINRKIAQIPGTLPAMSSKDLHAVINNFPAWVKSQRDSYSALGGPADVGVQGKNSLDTGKMGAKIKAQTGKTLTTNAYDHPLLNTWLNRKNNSGYWENKLWYKPVTAAAEDEMAKNAEEAAAETEQAGAVQTDPEPTAGEVTPDTSDVQPVYMAVVSPDDPRAVFKLIALVPASGTSTQPCVYSREDGEWKRDEQSLNDLRSATPPPVVPLDTTNLNDVLLQVDDAQAVGEGEDGEEGQYVDEAGNPLDGSAPEAPPIAAEQSVAASAVTPADFDLMVLWGPRKDIMQQALVAAGGADRNRGGAEKLRRYWLHGEGAAKIGWGTPGDWTRCVRHLGKYLGPRAKGYCALRHKEATGMWTGDKEHRQAFSSNQGDTLYSDALVASSGQIVQDSILRARAEIAKKRMALVASGEPGIPDPLDVIYPNAESVPEALVASLTPTGKQFFIPLALPEGIPSGDGRTVKKGVTEIRTLPLSLLWQFQTDDGHKGSVVVGRIDRLGRVPRGIGAGTGFFDTGVWGREAQRMVEADMLRFVSADMDNFGAMREKDESAGAAAEKEGEQRIGGDKLLIDQARVMAVTIVAKPAFQEATILIVPELVIEEEAVFPDGYYMDEVDPLEEAALVAAGYVAQNVPIAPPAEWFSNPHLTGPTPLTVTDEGRVYGHVAAWQSAHINPQLQGINPPRSKSNYGYFHTGVIRTEEGTDVTVGQLTLAGGHAGLYASAREAVKHYDDTGSGVADVHAGEDEFGIWVSGAIRPGTTPEQIRVFRASAPSGDWRPIRGNLELVAVCQVNVPGFPIARAMVASGHMTALVAAGAAPLARLKTDPLSELEARLEAVENFSQNELQARAAEIRARVAPALAARDAALQARAEAVFGLMESFGYVSKKTREEAADKGQALPDGSYPIRNVADLKNAIKAYGRAKESDRARVRRHIMKRARALGKSDLIPDNWKTAASEALTASVTNMRDIVEQRKAEFAVLTEEEKKRLIAENKPVPGGDADPKAQRAEGDTAPKYKPGHQPRDYNGQFRDVLARLKEDLGVSGNQGVVEQIKQVDAKTQTGDYAEAARSALDLKSTLDRLDDGALNKESIENVRTASKQLGEVIANLPLPFDNQAAKIRFTDLPPALRDLVEDFIKRTEDKIGKKDAAEATAKLREFKTGSDLFSQAEVSQELSKLLRLLT